MPLDVTGVVNGVETDERRHRHRPRAHTTARERSQPRDSTAFGEQLSQALRELQASGRGDPPQVGLDVFLPFDYLLHCKSFSRQMDTASVSPLTIVRSRIPHS